MGEQLERITVTAAAFEMRADYYQVRRWIVTGRLAGGIDERGKLYTTREALEDFKQRQRVAA